MNNLEIFLAASLSTILSLCCIKRIISKKILRIDSNIGESDELETQRLIYL